MNLLFARFIYIYTNKEPRRSMGEGQIWGRQRLRTERSLDGTQGFVRIMGLTQDRTWGRQGEHKRQSTW